MKPRGLFISFESIDGLGKTTQVALLAAALKHRGHDLFLTKEPGDARLGSNIGEGIRDLVFRSPTTKQMRPGVADLLFLADHIQTEGDIVEAIAAGKTVITDRYADSQFAYAAAEGKQCPPWALEAFERHYGLVPDITVLLIARGPGCRYSMDPNSPEDIAWALDRANSRRGAEAGKQDGKAWNSVKEQNKVQLAYLRRLLVPGRNTLAISVCPEDTREQVSARILHGLPGFETWKEPRPALEAV